MKQPAPEFSASEDAIETAAAEWVCERDAGFAPGRAAAFAAWRAADPRHEAAFVASERALTLIAEMPAVREPLEASLSGAAQPAHSTPEGRWKIFHLPAWAVGLAAALLIAAGVWWGGPARAETLHYVTAAARQQRIALQDGSVVNLNVASDVRVQLTPGERRVTLAAGEAHFAVAHDAARPFTVQAAGVAVRAIGTAFSVRLDGANVEVLVTEGKVEITRANAGTGANVAAASALPTDHPRLVAGERVWIRGGGEAVEVTPKVEQVSDDALRDAIRWHSEVMTFTNLPLRDVVAQFNRRNAMQLVLADTELGDRRVGGAFAADQVEAFVRLLEMDGDVKSAPRGPQEIVLRRAP